uniref:Uncharacterized protein n=1 Tax=Tanacetum cinerariifolium TaxID=118510 RepID=A0A699JQ42_TANCI|nr:hypothetical protein [Tanacetum cinerariifolium]
MSIQEMEDLKQQYLDEMKRLINSEHRDEIKIDEPKGNFNRMSIEINKKEKLQQLEQVANLNTYPSKHFNSFCYDDDDEDYTVVITPNFPITDSLIIENEHLDTIPETKSEKFIKSSVENLVPIPSESDDFSDIEIECDMPDCDDSQMTNFQRFLILSLTILPLVMTSQVTRSEFDPIHNEDLDFTPKNDHLDTKSYLLNHYSIVMNQYPSSIDSDDSDSEGDNIFQERLLHIDPIPFSETLDFSNVIRVFLPFFTYLVTSSILLSSGSEDTIFDPGIFSYHISF